MSRRVPYEDVLRFLDHQLEAGEVAAMIARLRGDEGERRRAAALLLQIGALGELARKDDRLPLRRRPGPSPVARLAGVVAIACCAAALILFLGRPRPGRPDPGDRQPFARTVAPRAVAPVIGAAGGRAGRALLIRGGDGAATGAGDQAMIRHLEGLGFTVTQALDDVVSAEDLSGARLVVISASTSGRRVRDRIARLGLREAPVPIVTCESASFDVLGMTGPRVGQGAVAGNGFGSTPAHTDIEIAATAHPLAAGFSGRLRIATAPIALTWGAPADTAIKVASLGGKGSGLGVQFAYERGAAMVGLAAPARRVACFVSEDAGDLLTTEGWALFEAGVRWASASP
jgi:hypothetical protein